MRRSVFLAVLSLFVIAFPGFAPAQTVEAPVAPPASIRLDRLEKLATHLDRVPASKFNMSVWGNRADTEDESYSGCAAGHATTLFSGEGFKLSFSASLTTVTYQKAAGQQACEQFFGISHADSDYLFMVAGLNQPDLVDPRAAARRIRTVLARERLTAFRQARSDALCELAGW